MAELQGRTPLGHLNSLRSRLGRAAQIGGLAYVERVATSDHFAAAFVSVDAATRIAMLATVARALEKAKRTPPAQKPISPDRRVKVRWSDEMIARLRREALRVKDNKALAARLGLPSFCEGTMKMARSRYLSRRSATQKDVPMPRREAHAATLPLAA